MKREIKASEVREGMEVEWSKGGITYQMQCQRKVEFKSEFLKKRETTGYNFCTEGGGVQYVSADQEVTVLAEPQPDEPLAFGACVEVAGVKYVRDNAEERGEWENVWFSEYRLDDRWAHTWEQICERGLVTVINPDPFTNTEPREPRAWKRWADVPEMTPVRTSAWGSTHRKVGDRVERRQDGSWIPVFASEYNPNKYASFTEVPGAL